MTTHSTAEQPADLPVVCNMLAIPADQRASHEARANELFGRAVVEQRDLPDGYAFRLDAADYELAAAFVANERRCCPFLRFQLDLAPAGGPIWLRMTGAAGAREALAAGLADLKR
jgi:hypothetical protein